MGFLLNETDLRNLLDGKTTIEKLTDPDRFCLIAFTGMDIRLALEKRGIELNKEEFLDLLCRRYCVLNVR